MTSLPRMARDERGIALMMTLLLAFAVAALAVGAIALAGSGALVSRFQASEAGLQAAADGGLELARDSLNRAPASLPDTGYVAMLTAAPATDAAGRVIAGYTRSVYYGRTGGRAGGVGSAGQYGNNLASIVSVISNPRGAVAARRLLLTQDSWSKFAVAINQWTNPSIRYGCDESIQGPFHSNTLLVLSSGCSSPKTLFAGPVTVSGSVTNAGSGNFTRGLQTGVPAIPWPQPADLNRLRSFAQAGDAVNGDYDLAGDPSLSTTAPSVRIEFVPVDVNGDGTIEWDEGFFRVFRGADQGDTTRAYVTARIWPRRPPEIGGAAAPGDADQNLFSPNCGQRLGSPGVNRFVSARDRWTQMGGAAVNARKTQIRSLLNSNSGNPRCYLGGDPALFYDQPAGNPEDTLTPAPALTAPWGSWVPRRLGPWAPLAAVRPGDAAYLIPLGANINFRGVIFVRGSVAISGRLRGRVTVAATGNVMLADDLTYVTPPGTDCTETGDILGAFSQDSVLIEKNNLQGVFKLNNAFFGKYDDTPSDANYNMFILALQDWGGEDYYPPGQSGWPAEPQLAGQACGGAPRGCVRVTGGITEGFIRIATYSNAGGWAERHAYDACGAIAPPPYWPTTGRYSRNRYYELDPVWLNQLGIAGLFRTLQSQ